MNDAISIGIMRPSTSHLHRRGTQLLVLIAIATQVAGNVFLSHGMRRAGVILSASPLDYVRAINLWTIAGVCMLAIWMVTATLLPNKTVIATKIPFLAK